MPRPPNDEGRITDLDAIRGVAVLAILVMNVVSFGLPPAAYLNLAAAGSDTAIDWVVGVAGELVVDQKAMGLFSLLFGAGVVLFADAVERRGGAVTGRSLWRNTLLLVIGIMHTLVWEGDVLVVYALCAPVVLLLRHRRARELIAVAAVLVSCSAVLAWWAQASLGPAGAGLGEVWLLEGGEPSDTVGIHLLVDAFARALAMMLLGVAALRLGLLDGRLPTSSHRRVTAVGLAVGLPLVVAGVWWQVSAGFAPTSALVGTVPNTLATVPLTLAAASAVTRWNRRSTAGVVRLRAVGRMALTNYLSQTILGVVVLRVLVEPSSFGRGELAVFVLVVSALQLWWSPAWLDRFRYGPAEWAWRSATYLSWQPLRRIPTDPAIESAAHSSDTAVASSTRESPTPVDET